MSRYKLENSETINLPDFIIVGAGKSGTTSLHRLLSEHPQIYMPSNKETWFFQLISNPNKEILTRLPYLPTTFEEYIELYKEAKTDQVCGEATPCYLHFPEYTIPNIKKYHPGWSNLKIVIILREPIDKIISQYRFQLKIGMEYLPINEALNPSTEKSRRLNNNSSVGFHYVSSTHYSRQIKMYLENFTKVKIFSFDQLKSDPDELMKNLHEFLEIEDITYNKVNEKFNNTIKRNPDDLKTRLKHILIQSRVLNLIPESKRTKIIRSIYWKFTKESLNSKTRSYLNMIFKEDVQKLHKLTGLNVKAWLKNYEKRS